MKCTIPENCFVPINTFFNISVWEWTNATASTAMYVGQKMTLNKDFHRRFHFSEKKTNYFVSKN